MRAKGSAPAKPVQADCPECLDAKFVRYDVEMRDPRFGRLFPCPKCNQTGIGISAGLLDEERKIRILDLDVAERPNSQAMLVAAKTFIQNPIGFLSFCGGNGNGKTVMLMGIVNACLELGIEARYVTAHQLMDYLYEAFDEKVLETDRGRITRLASIPVLAIDELDKARDTPYAYDMQHHLFDQRYRSKDAIGTVFAWNGNLSTIPWPAVRSRLSEFPVIENQDEDMRPILGMART